MNRRARNESGFRDSLCRPVEAKIWATARCGLAMALFCCCPVQTSLAQADGSDPAEVTDPKPLLTTWARQTAASVAEPGTAKHTAALRAALAAAGCFAIDDDGQLRTSYRSPLEATSAELEPRILGVDSDLVYQQWLRQRPAVYSLSHLGLDATYNRSVNGIYITSDDRTLADVVALVKKDGETICSGVLVDPRVVLTAAHCVCMKPDSVYVGRTTHSIEDWEARHERKFPNLIPGVPKEEWREWFEEDHECNLEGRAGRSLYGYDYGVLILTENVRPELASPVPYIADEQNLRDISRGDPLIVVGFGTNPAYKENSGWKNYVEVPVLSPNCVGDGMARRYQCVPHREMVSALGPYDRSPCEGDSGGAAFMLDTVKGTPERPARTLVALVSRAVGFLNDDGNPEDPVWPVSDHQWRDDSAGDAICSGATIFTLVGPDVRKLIEEARTLLSADR